MLPIVYRPFASVMANPLDSELSTAATTMLGSGPFVEASVTVPLTLYGSGLAIETVFVPVTPRYVALTDASPAVTALMRPATAVRMAVFDELHSDMAVTSF